MAHLAMTRNKDGAAKEETNTVKPYVAFMATLSSESAPESDKVSESSCSCSCADDLKLYKNCYESQRNENKNRRIH